MEESELTKKLEKESPAGAAFNRIYELAQTLRGEGGCPWDKEQTPYSMRRNLMEETFEAIDAITEGDANHAKEEMGDVFFNTVLTAYMYEQMGDWKIADCLNQVCDKLVRRHPHVFGQISGEAAARLNENPDSGERVKGQWDKIKEEVEGRKGKSVLDGIPQFFPPLLKSYKLLKKAAKAGFEWPSLQDARNKISEELSEVDQAKEEVDRSKRDDGSSSSGASNSGGASISSSSGAINKDGSGSSNSTSISSNSASISGGGEDPLHAATSHLEEEIGDLLLTIVNYARRLGIDPTLAMDRANRKFERRFRFVEKRMAEQNFPMDGGHLAQMEEAWKGAKREEGR